MEKNGWKHLEFKKKKGKDKRKNDGGFRVFFQKLRHKRKKVWGFFKILDYFAWTIHILSLVTGKKHRNEKRTENLKNLKKRFMIGWT